MAYAQGSTKAYWLMVSLAVSACGGSSSQAGPQQQAGSASESTKPASTEAGKGGSGAKPSSTGGSPTPAAAAGGGGRTRTQEAGSGAMVAGGKAGEGATPASTGAGGTKPASQAGEPAADGGMRFSFFVTSFVAMQRLSGSADGFGGDLRYGESDGLQGADKICREIAESSMPGAGSKTWRAFLSATKGTDGMPVHAIDRIGEGPWYDRLGRVFAMVKPDLINVRPAGADPAIINDFPNEDGVPNHAPDGSMQVDNHDVLTGSGTEGKLFGADAKYTCKDWTSAVGADGTPRVGHSWPRSGTPVMGPMAGTSGEGPRVPPGGAGRGGPPPGWMMGGSGASGRTSGDHWMSALTEAGCAPGASLVEMGGPDRNNPTVGSGGGYGGIYCFALTP